MRFVSGKFSLSLTLALAALAWTDVARAQEVSRRVSEFGAYEGYSEERFREWTTASQYVRMRDGVELAVDVTRPAADGVAADEALPVVWTHSRYHRNPQQLQRMLGGGGAGIRSMVDVRDDLQRLVRHGYVVVAVGVRGSGASFGRFEGLFSEAETEDAAEITTWLAEQPWCDGNVGMWGGSYLGITQYMTAAEAPPALKAIFPDVAAFDMYEVIHPGGVFRQDMLDHWAGLTKKLDTEWLAPAVDGDDDEVMLREAAAEHADNWDVMGEYSAGSFRDHDTPGLAWAEHGPSSRLAEIQEAGVPAYHFNAWFDIFVLDAALWYANYEGPQKLAIGAWAHAGVPDRTLMAERKRLTSVEQHRWFDRWLKGIENGVDKELPVHYALMVEPGEWVWKSAATWPLPEAQPTRYYFAAGPSISVDSVNDGLLTTEAPTDTAAHDEYEVDPTTTTGSSSRWDNAVGGAPVMIYRGLAENDARALTYTTEALKEPVTVTGHPVATLFVTAEAEDADFYVLLEEVDEEGDVRYVTEGVLRGSLRGLSEAPWDNLGLPYQRCFEADAEPLSATEPVEIVMDLHPTAVVFDAGHRIRVTVMGADADNTVPPPGGPTTLRVLRGGASLSGIMLPVVPD